MIVIAIVIGDASRAINVTGTMLVPSGINGCRRPSRYPKAQHRTTVRTSLDPVFKSASGNFIYSPFEVASISLESILV